jgi:arginyl-tRNA synthetase
LEIDVAKAKQQNNDNPLYYVQYAYARVNQLMAKAKELFVTIKTPRTFRNLMLDQEFELINTLLYFKHTIELISTKYEVNKMTIYLTNLAKQFHNYYANVKILDKDNRRVSIERLFLAKAIQQVIRNGLNLLGINVVDKM